MIISTYDEAVAYIDRHIALGVKPGLERIDALLELMGRPQDIAPVVHVTGTNGKTTVSRMITALLSAHGLKVGTFTSPHLERIEERFAIDGEVAGREAFAQAIADVAPFVDILEGRTGERATYFELTAAGALAHFASNAVDVSVVEVGLGGRLDATNIIDAEVAVLTSVGLDHTSYLGNTIESIAAEKLAIVKEGAALVTGLIPDVVLGMAERRAAEQQGVWRAFGREFSVTSDLAVPGGRLTDIEGVHEAYGDIFVPLHGRHQVANLAVAVAAAEEMFGRPLSPEAVRDGAAAVRSPGRVEVVGSHPLVVLDGAHNEQAMEALAETLLEDFDGNSWNLVIGVLDDKDVRRMLSHLDGLVERVFVTAADSPRAMDPRALAAIVDEVLGDVVVTVVPTVPRAVADALEATERDGALLVTGSLYVVGEARPLLTAIR
jgi:dihydrofolate synthase/folylpolyglutamate synthase